MIMLTLMISVFTQEFISRNSAIRSHTSTNQELSVNVALQRFKDAFCAESESPVKLPVPSPGQLEYEIKFSSAPKSHSSFEVIGEWKKSDSIFNPPMANPGLDYSNVPDSGYYSTHAVTGYDSTNVPPGYNLVSLNSPTTANYVAVYGYFFPFGAYAPKGKINLEKAYSITNPIDSESSKQGNYSGAPVNVYAQNDVEVVEYPYGRAYSANGVIKVTGKGKTETGGLKNGVLKYTSLPVIRINEFNRYKDIFEDQVSDAYKGLRTIALDKSVAFFDKPVTGFSDYSLKKISGNFLTLEQSASFPFTAVTCYEMPEMEEEMGNDYKLTIHPPFVADKVIFIAPAPPLEAAAKTAVSVSDTVKEVFDDNDIPWMVTPTDACLLIADAEMAVEIADTIEDLSEAAELPPPFDVIMAAYYTAKLIKLGYESTCLGIYEVAFYSLRAVNVEFLSHLFTGKKQEPLTHPNDKKYSNKNYPLVALCTPARIIMMRELIGTSTWLAKFALLATTLLKIKENHRLLHFGEGKFEDYFQKINKQNFKYNGTMTIPRGRTMKFSGNLTILGDLWIKKGGCLYVDGNLMVKRSFNAFPISPLVAPAGRIFLEDGATVLVEKSLSCQGDVKYGSIVAISPAEKVKPITCAVFTNTGSVTIPYGIMPGISMQELAKYSKSSLSKSFDAVFDNAGDLAKVAGPFYARTPFFASYAASLLFFRDKNLNNPLFPPFIVPLSEGEGNITNEVFEILTDAFSMRLNAYLGENFFTHSGWWFFGEGIVPVFPKVHLEKMSAQMSSLSGTLSTVQSVAGLSSNLEIIKDKGSRVISTAESVASSIYKIYTPFIASVFLSPCDKLAEVAAMLLKNQAKSAYKDFEELKEKSENLESSVDSVMKTYSNFYDTIDSIVTADEQYVFQSIPGVLVYSGGAIQVGAKTSGNQFLPLSGMLIAKDDLNINGKFNAVGCLVSLEGSIIAPGTRLQFYPYFTRASIYQPLDVKGNINTGFLTTGKALSGRTPFNVGITMPRVITEGWETYSELYEINRNTKN